MSGNLSFIDSKLQSSRQSSEGSQNRNQIAFKYRRETASLVFRRSSLQKFLTPNRVRVLICLRLVCLYWGRRGGLWGGGGVSLPGNIKSRNPLFFGNSRCCQTLNHAVRNEKENVLPVSHRKQVLKFKIP